jgi:hypothetical protein
MPVEESLNKILKEMWRLDEKESAGVALDDAEKDFYIQNLHVIQEYYEKNTSYWNTKK